MKPEDRAQQEKDDLIWLASSERGRRLLWSIIGGRAGAIGSTFCQELTHRAAFLEGKRGVGLDLLADVQVCARADSVSMLSEAFSRQEEDRVEAEAERKKKEQERNDGR